MRNVILQTTFSGLEPVDLSEVEPVDPSDTVWADSFTTSATGDLDITVDWTFASNDLDVLLARGTLAQAQSAACQEDTAECPLELVASTTTLSKPEVLRISGLAAGSYLVVVVNFGTTNESGVVVVGFTS